MAVRKFKPFTPYGIPPKGLYDPGIDQTEAAGERGLMDLTEDATLANRRGLEDYGFGVSDANRTQSRGMEDIGLQRRYATEDRDRAVQMLSRQYQQLGSRQGEQARVAGVQQGGALLQANRKRQENQAIDMQPIDRGYGRALEGFGRAEGRLTEDTNTQIARLGVQAQRGTYDSGVQVARGGREQNQLHEFDAPESRLAQANAAGYDPGPKPSNLHLGPQGQTKTITQGNTIYVIDQHGNVISQRPRRAR